MDPLRPRIAFDPIRPRIVYSAPTSRGRASGSQVPKFLTLADLLGSSIHREVSISADLLGPSFAPTPWVDLLLRSSNLCRPLGVEHQASKFLFADLLGRARSFQNPFKFPSFSQSCRPPGPNTSPGFLTTLSPPLGHLVRER